MKFVRIGLILLALSLGLSSLYAGSYGFSIWTAETFRQVRLIEKKPKVISYPLVDQSAQFFELHSDKPIVLLNFIYTKCPTVCQTSGGDIYRLYNRFKYSQFDDKVSVITISFDESDSINDLAFYLNMHKGDGNIWRVAKLRKKADLDALLAQLGVVVLDDKRGGFIHNNTVYVLQNGTLINLFYPDEARNISQFIGQITS